MIQKKRKYFFPYIHIRYSPWRIMCIQCKRTIAPLRGYWVLLYIFFSHIDAVCIPFYFPFEKKIDVYTKATLYDMMYDRLWEQTFDINLWPYPKGPRCDYNGGTLTRCTGFSPHNVVVGILQLYFSIGTPSDKPPQAAYYWTHS